MNLIDEYKRISKELSESTDLEKWSIAYFYTKTKKITLKYSQPKYPTDTIAQICAILKCAYTDFEMMVRDDIHLFTYSFPNETQ